jgi:hypothetical protein
LATTVSRPADGATYDHLSARAKEIKAPDTGIQSPTLSNDSRLNAVSFSLAQGQGPSKHSASMPTVLHFLQSEAKLTLARRSVGTSGRWGIARRSMP